MKVETYHEATAAAIYGLLQNKGSRYAFKAPLLVRVDVEWTEYGTSLHVERAKHGPPGGVEVTYLAKVRKNWLSAIHMPGMSLAANGFIIFDARPITWVQNIADGASFYEVRGPSPDKQIGMDNNGFIPFWQGVLANYGGLNATAQTARDALCEVLKAHQRSLGLPPVGFGGINLHTSPAVSEEDE